MKNVFAVVLLVAATSVAAADQTFGKGVTLADATSIKALYDAPATFVGKTIRVDGVVTAVCQEMGCWMALGSDANAEQVVRFKVDHEGAITFPTSAKGKRASAPGVFGRIADGDKEGQEAAKEQDAKGAAAAFGKTYQIKVTGAIVRQ
jgi:hypothetical protein